MSGAMRSMNEWNATKVLISGSRDATLEMLRATVFLVEQLHEQGYHLVVGDAHGVDESAVKTAQAIGMPFMCYGITPRPRIYSTRPIPYQRCYGSYLQRDMVMAHAATRGIFLWNGYSRGTKFTHDYMAGLGKVVELRKFGGGK
jgi:hypothetical protein